jgi:hypothetical protein
MSANPTHRRDAYCELVASIAAERVDDYVTAFEITDVKRAGSARSGSLQ